MTSTVHRGATAPSDGSTVAILGVEIHDLEPRESAAWLVDHTRKVPRGYVVTANLDILRQACKNPGLRRLVDGADVVVADGAPLVVASRILGTPLSGRVCGSDLLSSIAQIAAGDGWPIAIVGGPPGAAELAAQRLRRAHSGLDVAPFFLDFDHPWNDESFFQLCRFLKAQDFRFVFLALGFPRQERLARRLIEESLDTWFIGVGAAVEFEAGLKERAPVWMQRAGLEALHRLITEPRRLSRRYVLQGLPFLVTLIVSSCRTRLTRAGAQTHPLEKSRQPPLVVTHFGPSTELVGGMGSAIAEFCTVQTSVIKNRAVTTWYPDRAAFSMFAATRAALRLVTTRQPGSVVHVHLSERGSFIREGMVLVAARVSGRPSVATIHGADFTAFAASHPKLVRRILLEADRVVVLGPKTRRIVERLAPTLRVFETNNPVASPRSVPEPPEPGAPHQVVFAGEVSLRKGFDRLLAAWPLVRRNLPRARLAVAGPWHLESHDPKELPPGIDYLGSLSRADCLEAIAGSDVACLPARAEALPMFLLEALTHGVMVVATRVGEVDKLEGLPTCRLVGEAPEDLAVAIVDLARARRTDPSLRTTAMRWAEANCSLTAVMDAHTELYRSLATQTTSQDAQP